MRYIQRILHSALDKSLEQFFSSLTEIKIIQIGANDGERLDPVVSLIQRYRCKAILAEPVPYLCEKLERKYGRNHNIAILQKAITPQNDQGDLPFYHFEEKEGLPFNNDFTLWGSFSKEHLGKFRKAVPYFEDLATSTMIPTMGINDLIAGSGFEQVDYLQVDAEGYDEQLISAINLDKYQPSLIRFEHLHSNRAHVFVLLDKLARAGYQTYSLGMDTICITGPGKKYFRFLAMVKALHSNWLMPARDQSKRGRWF